MVELEKYKGAKSRFTCPSCGSRNTFARYQNENGEYLDQNVGRCNRESKCGYHYKPVQFFADNPAAKNGRFKKGKNRTAIDYDSTDKNSIQTNTEAKLSPIKPDYIPFEQFKLTLGNYEQNAFVQFLQNLFPDCADEIQSVLEMYFIGTFQDYTCFPSIDRSRRVCRAKLIRFNTQTGKRLKGNYDTSSLPAKLKLKEDFQYKQIFFGEHLLSKFPDKPVAIVEAEKTAIIASLCFPKFIWIGSNSKTWLKVERLIQIGKRQIILYPDADAFELWQQIASDANKQGLKVEVSNLVENHATNEEKANGYDLADYLIFQQNEINEINEFVDHYNSALEKVLNDQTLFGKFNINMDERIAINEVDQNLSRVEAETIAIEPENIRQIVLGLV